MLRRKLFLSLLMTCFSMGLWAAVLSVDITPTQALKDGGVDPISIVCAKGDGSAAPAISSGQLRLYQAGTGKTTGNTMTFSSSYPITSIVFTFASDMTASNGVFSEGSYNAENFTWTGNTTSVTLTVTGTTSGKRIYITAMTVSYDIGDAKPVCAKPSFSPAAGTYEEPQNVAISSTEGATIYYTTDGTEPSTASNVYSDPLVVSQTTTIKAFAVKADYDDSEVVTAEYTILPTPDVLINLLDEGWNFPTTNTVEETAYTNGDFTLKVAGSEGAGFKVSPSKYFIIGKKGAYIELPMFARPVDRIVVAGNDAGSAAVTWNFYRNDEAVSTEATGCKNDLYTFAITDSKAGDVYRLQVTGNANLQIKKIKVYFAAESNDKFRVAGSSLALFYRIWEASHPHGYTDMKLQADGTYQLLRDGITLPVGEIKYQVVMNNDFAYSWPADTAVLNVPEDGIYDVTFTFNSTTTKVGATLDKVGDVTIVNPVYLKGSWDDWTSALLVPQGDYNDKVVTWLPLTAGDYTFKMLDKNGNSYGDGEVFSRDDASHLKMTLGEGEELVLHADVDGDYIFTYVFESQRLFITYPTIVPETKIAALGGKFTINSAGDTVQFARGNLLYNFGENAWFTAEDQAFSLGDANLRFGDPAFEGTIDMFGWSSEESNFGLLLSNDNADYENSNFVDWGTKFGSGKEWTTLSKSEWNYILARTENGRKLWTHAAIQHGTDTVYALLLFPNKWVAPAGLAIQYGYHPEDEIWEIAENNFFLADQWTLLEEAGTVLLPFAGRRTGFWLNRNNGYGDIWSKTVNPLMPNDSAYCWVDNANGMGYYWLSTPEGNAYQVATIILPGWHNDKWLAPTIWDEYKRRGHTVRLVKRTPAGGSTAVENTETQDTVFKTVENGILRIRRGNEIFNAQGQRIQ